MFYDFLSLFLHDYDLIYYYIQLLQVMNQIQRYTFTIISRIRVNGKLKIKGEDGEEKDGEDEEGEMEGSKVGKKGQGDDEEEEGKGKGKGKAARRRRRMEDDDGSDESDHGSRFRRMELDSSDEDDEDDEEEEEDDFQDAIEGDESPLLIYRFVSYSIVFYFERMFHIP